MSMKVKMHTCVHVLDFMLPLTSCPLDNGDPRKLLILAKELPHKITSQFPTFKMCKNLRKLGLNVLFTQKAL